MVLDERVKADCDAEQDEGDDLAEARERGVKRSMLGASR